MHVNLEILKTYAGDDPEFLKEMINKFNTEMPGVISNLEKNLEERNFDEVKRIAHKMIGTTGVFYIQAAPPILQQIEQKCNAGPDYDELVPMVAEVRQIIEESISELEIEKEKM